MYLGSVAFNGEIDLLAKSKKLFLNLYLAKIYLIIIIDKLLIYYVNNIFIMIS